MPETKKTKTEVKQAVLAVLGDEWMTASEIGKQADLKPGQVAQIIREYLHGVYVEVWNTHYPRRPSSPQKKYRRMAGLRAFNKNP